MLNRNIVYEKNGKHNVCTKWKLNRRLNKIAAINKKIILQIGFFVIFFIHLTICNMIA